MKISEVKCRKCGQDANQAAQRGAYLGRVNPKGETPCISQCKPSCEHKHGNPADALIRAINAI